MHRYPGPLYCFPRYTSRFRTKNLFCRLHIFHQQWAVLEALVIHYCLVVLVTRSTYFPLQFPSYLSLGVVAIRISRTVIFYSINHYHFFLIESACIPKIQTILRLAEQPVFSIFLVHAELVSVHTVIRDREYLDGA